MQERVDSRTHRITLSQFLQIGFLDLSDGTKATCPAQKLATIDMSTSGNRELVMCDEKVKNCQPVKDANYLDESTGHWANGGVSSNFYKIKTQERGGKPYLLKV